MTRQKEVPASVEEYLAQLPAGRRECLEQVRRLFRENLDPTFAEGIQYGMIGYYVPHERYPAGYHCDPTQPLPFASIASQKNHMAIYLFCLYLDQQAHDQFIAAWKRTGRKLDMGKSCIRFKKIDDLALDVLAGFLRRITADRFIELYDQMRPDRNRAEKPTSRKRTGRSAGKGKAGGR
ncbi:MAG: hypothetical protein KatS3mg110_3039 [Pirellulaceae bacterium]|nr:MAG: hypothetical protein KatS3mg110_3039 [Pirellulaceae bacterium]